MFCLVSFNKLVKQFIEELFKARLSSKGWDCTTDCNSPDTLSLSLLFLKSDLLDTLTYTIPHTL